MPKARTRVPGYEVCWGEWKLEFMFEWYTVSCVGLDWKWTSGWRVSLILEESMKITICLKRVMRRRLHMTMSLYAPLAEWRLLMIICSLLSVSTRFMQIYQNVAERRESWWFEDFKVVITSSLKTNTNYVTDSEDTQNVPLTNDKGRKGFACEIW